MPKSYLVQGEDGVSRFTLGDGSGFLLLAEWAGIATVTGHDEPVASVEGGTVAVVTVTGNDRPAATVGPT